MKKMEKVLAVGALLVMGTVAMGSTASSLGSAEETFNISINVIEPISIKKISDIDFGNVEKNSLKKGLTAKAEFEVTGSENTTVLFDVQDSDQFLRGGINGGTIEYKSDVVDQNGATQEEGRLNDKGKHTAYMQTTLTDVDNATHGSYTGTTKLIVSYK